MSDLRADEVLRKFLSDFRESTIADNGDFLDLAMMIVNETEVPRHCLQILPTGELLGMNEDAPQHSTPREMKIDVRREISEVGLRKRPLRFDDHNVVIFEYLIGEHDKGIG